MWILPKQLHTLASVRDTEALSLDLSESSQLCAQSLFARSKLSPLRTWLQKWKRDSWTQHLFGRILKPSLGKAFEIEWTSLLEVIPVSPLVQQASEPVRMTHDTCGLGSQMELLPCDPGSASSRTSKDTSRWGCPTSSRTWDDWVTERRGAYSARLNAVRLTSASESLSWPSPVASEVRQGFQDRSRGMKGSQESLTTVVIKHGPAAPDNHNTHGSRPESWSTPTVTDASAMSPEMRPSRIATGRTTEYLARQIQWATPQARDAKGAEGRMIRDGTCSDLPSQTEVDQTGKWNRDNGKLNPRWVETLMGLPVGWTMPSCASPVTIAPTNCASSETESSQPQQL